MSEGRCFAKPDKGISGVSTFFAGSFAAVARLASITLRPCLPDFNLLQQTDQLAFEVVSVEKRARGFASDLMVESGLGRRQDEYMRQSLRTD